MGSVKRLSKVNDSKIKHKKIHKEGSVSSFSPNKKANVLNRIFYSADNSIEKNTTSKKSSKRSFVKLIKSISSMRNVLINTPSNTISKKLMYFIN